MGKALMLRTTRYMLWTLTLALSGCGISESGLNPFNWFGQDEDVELVSTLDVAAVVDDRPLVQSIESVVVERLPGGAIVRATGLPPNQGWYDAQLVREGGAAAGTGVVVFSFRARPPKTPTRVSTQQSRELLAGAYLSDTELEGLTSIRVLSATNARTVGR